MPRKSLRLGCARRPGYIKSVSLVSTIHEGREVGLLADQIADKEETALILNNLRRSRKISAPVVGLTRPTTR